MKTRTTIKQTNAREAIRAYAERGLTLGQAQREEAAKALLIDVKQLNKDIQNTVRRSNENRA